MCISTTGIPKDLSGKALLAIPDQKEIVLLEELYEKPKYVRLNKRLYTL